MNEVDRLELSVGSELARIPFRIEQFEEDVFACLIGDYDPMHNDPNWHFDAGWGGTIALGFHVIAFTDRFLSAARVGDGLVTAGFERVRFTSPLPIGSEVTCVVTLEAIDRDGGQVRVTTSLRTEVAGSEKPTMVARHLGVLGGRLSPAPVAIEAIPAGRPIAESGRHGAAFYRGVAARSGEWLGTTPWTTVDQRSADLFGLLAGERGRVQSDPLWWRTRGADGQAIVHPLHVLALRSYFMPQIGLPVLSDRDMAAFNYGLDNAVWHASVPTETRLRDHVRLLDVVAKAPSRYLVRTQHIVEAEGNPSAVLTADCLSLFALTEEGMTDD